MRPVDLQASMAQGAAILARWVGAMYRVGPVPWGKYVLHLECAARDVQNYTMRVRCSAQIAPALRAAEPMQEAAEQQWE